MLYQESLASVKTQGGKKVEVGVRQILNVF